LVQPISKKNSKIKIFIFKSPKKNVTSIAKNNLKPLKHQKNKIPPKIALPKISKCVSIQKTVTKALLYKKPNNS
jgi:hypothetical protein